MLNFKNFPSKKTNAQQQDPASEDVPPWAAESMLGEFKSCLVNLPPLTTFFREILMETNGQ